MKIDWLLKIIFEESYKYQNKLTTNYTMPTMQLEMSHEGLEASIIREMFHDFTNTLGKKYSKEVTRHQISSDSVGNLTEFNLRLFVFSESELAEFIETIINKYTPERLMMNDPTKQRL